MNMLSDEQVAIRPVLKNPMPLPVKPEVTRWDWFKYYVYNFFRRPKVKRKQRELMGLFRQVKDALQRDVYPELEKRMDTCEMCRDAYQTLYPQIFLSQIYLILKRMKCSSHHAVFDNFLIIHNKKFEDSEAISSWINGFTK